MKSAQAHLSQSGYSSSLADDELVRRVEEGFKKLSGPTALEDEMRGILAKYIGHPNTKEVYSAITEETQQMLRRNGAYADTIEVSTSADSPDKITVKLSARK